MRAKGELVVFAISSFARPLVCCALAFNVSLPRA
jgi:hypothetical protein